MEKRKADEIIRRIADEAGVSDVVGLLGEKLRPTDLKSLMMEVYSRRAAGLTPRAILDRFLRDKTVRPSPVDAILLADVKRLAYEVLPAGFQAIELSPVAPLGVTSVLTNLHQNNAVATAANTEVTSDPTNVLALECAVRRRGAFAGEGGSEHLDSRVRLCTCHRCVRAQTAVGPASAAHFELLALCTAGSAQPDHSFEAGALLEHVRTYLRLCTESARLGFLARGLRVSLSNFGRGDDGWLRRQVASVLHDEHTALDVVVDPDRRGGRNYYTTAAFQVHATDPDGRELNLADGGMVDWTQQLLANRKERLLISGFGLERYLACFFAGSPPPRAPS
jgi:hypothetical protein